MISNATSIVDKRKHGNLKEVIQRITHGFIEIAACAHPVTVLPFKDVSLVTVTQCN